MFRWLVDLWRPRPPHGRSLGRFGEAHVAQALRRRGYRVLERNAMSSVGEADLVLLAPDRRTVVFVEVKTRAAPQPGEHEGPPPEASITSHKSRKLVQVAEALARARGWTDRPLRIDVAAVIWSPDGRHVLRHHENAVSGLAR